MRPANIAIVTDSTADIPDDILDLYNIHVINNIIVIDGKSYEDRVDISREDFYTKLPLMKTFPTTATASAGAYESLYNKLFEQGSNYILSIHPSSKLSGIFSTANIAAQSFSDKVKVIDGENITLGLGFQVIAAAEAVKKGATVENIINHLSDIRRRLKLVAMLDTLEYVRRSGRVSWVRARLGNLLQVKPILEVKNGLVLSLGEVRTFRKGIARLSDILSKCIPMEKLAILHTNAEDEANNFLRSIQNIFSGSTYIVNVTSVIGSHVGPHGLGFVAISKN